ncbi:MAG: transporter substrate-binding domain-containing protein, partial [Mycobacterium sp.]|nr:transporter substrate-binding domain-containing protein [Mycobacterium sp.]
MTEKFRTVVLAGLVGAVVLLGAGCSAEDPTPPGLAEPTGTIPVQQVDPRLRDRLPAHIKQSGSLVAVNSGAFPPYELIQPDGTVRGASADLLNAIGQLWGIDIKHATVDGLSGLLAGIASERYQLGFGPSGDFKERQQRNDFIDYVQEFVVFGVPAGNPKNITGLKSTCGMRIAVQAGGSAEAVIEKQQQTCLRAGQPPVQVMSFKDHPQSILS